jgi:methanogenic corrinoid protein MtbC1
MEVNMKNTKTEIIELLKKKNLSAKEATMLLGEITSEIQERLFSDYDARNAMKFSDLWAEVGS